MTIKELAREAWEVARGISKTSLAHLSWREAIKIMRRSLGAAVCERVVGIVVLGTVVCALFGALYLVLKLWTAAH